MSQPVTQSWPFKIINHWHNFLGLPQQPNKEWYQARLTGEIKELAEATSWLHKLSETSDVYYIFGRAAHDGFLLEHPSQLSELSWWRAGMACSYMLAKYSLRWGFYRIAAWACRGHQRPANERVRHRGEAGGVEELYHLDDNNTVREVVNPGKDSKIFGVAQVHGFDEEKFLTVCRRLRCVWPLLP